MVGVRFNFNGSTHYGWIAFEANLNKTNSATITGWAYETIPGKPIAAGDTNAVPELNASNLTFSAVATNQMTLNWVPGDGVRRMVVAHADTAVSWTPTDGNAYPANTNLASAADVGGGNCVVYDGSDSNITVTGLDPNRVYCFKVFEYYGTDDPSSYLYLKTGIPAANSQLTLASAAAPLQIQSIFNAGSSSFQLQWQSSSGKKYGVWRTTDLSLAFTRIATGIDATPPTNNYTDQTAPAQQAFYKIEEE